jgi:hypothetical protein
MTSVYHDGAVVDGRPTRRPALLDLARIRLRGTTGVGGRDRATRRLPQGASEPGETAVSGSAQTPSHRIHCRGAHQ